MSSLLNTALRAWSLGANITAIGDDGKEPLHPWNNKRAPWAENRQPEEVVRSIFKHTDRRVWNGQVYPPIVTFGIIEGISNYRLLEVDARVVDGVKQPVPIAIFRQLLDALGLPHEYPWAGPSRSKTGWHIHFISSGELPEQIRDASKKDEAGVKIGTPREPYAGQFDHIELRWERCQTVIPSPGGYAPGMLDAAPAEVPIENVIAAFLSIAEPKRRERPTREPKPKTQTNGSRSGSSNGHGHGATVREVIDAFNQRYDAGDILERNGYDDLGDGWAHPDTSQPGVVGVKACDNGKVQSFSATDPLNDGHNHDAFDCLRILEHDGDQGRAVEVAAQDLGLTLHLEPVFDAEGFACCPDHGETRLIQSKKGNWWCPIGEFHYWWKGENYTPQAAEGEQQAFNRSFVLKCFAEGEAGDAQLLAELYRGRLVYDHAASAWYMFGLHIWSRCDSPPRRIVWGTVAAAYLDLAASETRDLAQTTDEAAKKRTQEYIDALTERGKKLRSLSRINNVLTLAQELLGIKGDAWNADPWLLSAQNGIIDLRTGQLRAGQPTDYICIAAPVEWRGIDEPSPRFHRFLSEIMSDEADRVAFLLRLLGYSLNGMRTEHILPVCCGPRGRNGKSTLFETLQSILGDYALAGSNDILIDQSRDHSAGSASPHLMSLRGKRLIVCSETKDTARLDTAQVKRLTGGDTINARALHENEVQFRPTHTIFLYTNHKPQAPADEDALWERVIAIDFKLRFVDEPKPDSDERKRDPNLETALQKESSGVLAALVRGHLDWLKNGLQPPESVKLAREQYRLGESTDPFLTACCTIKADAETEATALYRAYETWCKRHDLKPKSQRWFGSELQKRFEKGNHATNRRTIYIGVALQTSKASEGFETPKEGFEARPNAENSPGDDENSKPSKAVRKSSEQIPLMCGENIGSGFEGFEGFRQPMTSGVVEESLPDPPEPTIAYRAAQAIHKPRVISAEGRKRIAVDHSDHTDHSAPNDPFVINARLDENTTIGDGMISEAGLPVLPADAVNTVNDPNDPQRSANDPQVVDHLPDPSVVNDPCDPIFSIGSHGSFTEAGELRTEERTRRPTDGDWTEELPADLPSRDAEVYAHLKRLKAERDAAAFVPSAEWQEVPEGAALPRGCEVRMDFASSKNYARLMPQDAARVE